MSGAAMAMQAALVAALRGLVGVTGVYDGPPAKAAYPHVVVDGGWTSDWSHKSGRGAEHRIVVGIIDDGQTANRLHQLCEDALGLIEAMPADLGGHRLVSLVFLSARIVRTARGPWSAQVQYRARTLEEA